jgi:hypothetical protein
MLLLRYISTLYILVLALLCSTAQAQAQSKQEVWQHYFDIKREMIKRHKKVPLDISYIDEVKTLVIFDCGFTEGVDFTESTAQNTDVVNLLYARLFEIAKTVIQFRNGMHGAGYPENTWKSDLIYFEDESVKSLINVLANSDTKQIFDDKGEYFESLITKLNMYNKTENKKLPRLLSRDGCGAGEFPVDIITQPLARILRLIPDFFAQVCINKNKTPEINGCIYWRDFPAKTSIGVSGLYQYEALWSDGTIRRGKVDFDKLKERVDGSRQFNIKK